MKEANDGFLRNQRLLVIAPHADDECFGCGGTIARMKAVGGEVYVLVMSVGDLKHFDGTDKIVTGEVRARELEEAMKVLKVDDWEIIWREPEVHLRLDTMPRRDLVAIIETKARLSLERLKPTMIAIPAMSYNQDHDAVFRAAFTACRPGVPQFKHFPPIVLVYDNTGLSWSLEREKFHPNFYVDISDYLETKLEALAKHRSQMRPSIHHSSLESVRNLAIMRGREISTYAAEGFVCLRFVF